MLCIFDKKTIRCPHLERLADWMTGTQPYKSPHLAAKKNVKYLEIPIIVRIFATMIGWGVFMQ